jgi:hypothetical protein
MIEPYRSVGKRDEHDDESEAGVYQDYVLMKWLVSGVVSVAAIVTAGVVSNTYIELHGPCRDTFVSKDSSSSCAPGAHGRVEGAYWICSCNAAQAKTVQAKE